MSEANARRFERLVAEIDPGLAADRVVPLVDGSILSAGNRTLRVGDDGAPAPQSDPVTKAIHSRGEADNSGDATRQLWAAMLDHRERLLAILRRAAGGALSDEDGVWAEINLVAALHRDRRVATSKKEAANTKRRRERYEAIRDHLREAQRLIAEAAAEDDEQMIWVWWELFKNSDDEQWCFAGDIAHGFTDMFQLFVNGAEQAVDDLNPGRGRVAGPRPTAIRALARIYQRATGRNAQEDRGKNGPFTSFVRHYLSAVGAERTDSTLEDDMRDALEGWRPADLGERKGPTPPSGATD